MKRLIASFVLMVCAALPASAETLPEQIRSEASRLLVTGDLQRFGLAASRLSLEIDQRGGPVDLRCIFRGMAEETDVQLKLASSATTGTAQAAALSRLLHMLKDAVQITPAVGGGAAAQKKAAANLKSAAAKCEAVRDF